MSFSKKGPDLHMTDTEIIDGCKRCIVNVEGFLDSARLLLASDTNNHQYALGLYMYAVEEFGKAILLKNYLKEKKNLYSIEGWIFGKKHSHPKSRNNSHNEKISKGFEELPITCRKLSRFVEVIFASDKTRTYIIKRGKLHNGMVSVPPYTTGIFEDSATSIEIDVDMKTSCFYMDWDENRKTWGYEIEVDVDKLNENIKLFEDRLRKFNCISNDEFTGRDN